MTLKPVLKVAAVHEIPVCYLSKGQNNTITAGGLLGNILKVFSDVINFDFQIVTPPDGQYGRPTPNGSWTGMIGMVHRGEVEFAMGPFAASPQRQSVTDLTTPVFHSNIGILTVRPTLETDILGMLRPFSLWVWLCVLFSFIFMVLSMALVDKIETRIYGLTPSKGLPHACQWALKALTQESSIWLPKKDGGRILVTTWLIASFVFMTSFGGVLTAMLTVPRVNIPINSLEDLVSQRDMPWRVIKGSFIVSFLKTSKNQVHQNAVEGVSGNIKNCYVSKESVIKGEFAIFCDDSSLLSMMNWDFSTSGTCHTYKTQKNVYSNIIRTLAFRRGSPYFEKANKILTALKESGILIHWLGQNISNATYCLRSPTSDRRSNAVDVLNVEAFGGSLILLAGGYFVSLVTFLLEKFLTKPWSKMEMLSNG